MNFAPGAQAKLRFCNSFGFCAVIVFDPGAGEPTQWVLCFSRQAATTWANYLPIGKYKHVRAFGFVAAINTWVFYDPGLNRAAISVARGDAAATLMEAFLYDADAVQIPAVHRERWAPRFGGWCVPAIKHLTGISSSALRPDALFRDCLRYGRALTAASPAD